MGRVVMYTSVSVDGIVADEDDCLDRSGGTTVCHRSPNTCFTSQLAGRRTPRVPERTGSVT